MTSVHIPSFVSTVSSFSLSARVTLIHNVIFLGIFNQCSDIIEMMKCMDFPVFLLELHTYRTVSSRARERGNVDSYLGSFGGSSY